MQLSNPTQDHIKLGWLNEYLGQIEFLRQYEWTAYTDEDYSESCIVGGEGELYSVDLTYAILLYIKEYTRPASELRRILLHWLNAANPQPHQVISILYKHIDADRHDLLISMEITETQQDEVCGEADAEGNILLPDGTAQWIRLARSKPDELLELLPPITKVNP